MKFSLAVQTSLILALSVSARGQTGDITPAPPPDRVVVTAALPDRSAFDLAQPITQVFGSTSHKQAYPRRGRGNRASGEAASPTAPAGRLSAGRTTTASACSTTARKSSTSPTSRPTTSRASSRSSRNPSRSCAGRRRSSTGRARSAAWSTSSTIASPPLDPITGTRVKSSAAWAPSIRTQRRDLARPAVDEPPRLPLRSHARITDDLAVPDYARATAFAQDSPGPYLGGDQAATRGITCPTPTCRRRTSGWACRMCGTRDTSARASGNSCPSTACRMTRNGRPHSGARRHAAGHHQAALGPARLGRRTVRGRADGQLQAQRDRL